VNDILQNYALEESYVEKSNSDFYLDTDEETWIGRNDRHC